ncbi:type VII toxin-antitoxin system MntA family adenylyltransferase antitoxin [Ekhidna sp.]|uniref:type VII toxin-antitoxin system MntA family adenylyltransferase antitoxin n=1 Tax=Ekhidna sp. TaxID=2608089 RepID=UPI003CCBAEAB
MLSKGIIDQISAFYRQEDSVSLVYIFGSAVSDQYGDTSDIDIAFLLKDGLPNDKQYLRFYERMQELTGRSVDLIDLGAADTVLKMEVVGKGMLILKRSGADQETFENKVFQEYLTLNDDRKIILDEIKQRGTVYG